MKKENHYQANRVQPPVVNSSHKCLLDSFLLLSQQFKLMLPNLEELPPNASNPFLWLCPSARVITGATTLGQSGPECTEDKGVIPFYS